MAATSNVQGDVYCYRSMLSSKDLINDVMNSHSESEDSEDVEVVEVDSDSECEREATPSHCAHVLPSLVSRVQNDSSLDSSYPSSSSSSTVAVDSNPSSLMSCLRRPTSSELSRKRVIKRVSPKGKKRCKGANSSDPKSVTPQQCVKKYANECLIVSNGKLFCLACREQMSLKCSVK